MSGHLYNQLTHTQPEELIMAKETRELKITMKQDEWNKHKKLLQKNSCRCYKDPSEIFKLGLETAIEKNPR